MAFRIKPQPPKRHDKRIPDKPYRDWIKTQPCHMCGCTRRMFGTILCEVEAAHTGPRRGLGLKANDNTCIPLCKACHTLASDSYHKKEPERKWAKHHGIVVAEILAFYHAKFRADGYELRTA